MAGINFITINKKRSLTLVLSIAAIVVASSPVFSFTKSALAAVSPPPATASLTLSPSTQTVGTGSNVVVQVNVAPVSGDSINEIQTVLSYPSSNFSLVGVTSGSGFGNITQSSSTGSLQLTVYIAPGGSTVKTSQTAATITLRANTAGSSLPIKLANVCAAGKYPLTCSAAYDSYSSGNVVSPNDLIASSSISPAYITVSQSSGSGSNNPVPVISGIQVTNITDTSATINWQTSIAATSVVNYGLNTHYGLSAQSTQLTTDHSLKIGAPYLTPSTTFYFYVSSATSTGASSTSSGQQLTTAGLNVSLVVVNSQGQPIGGALVTLDGKTVTTQANGVATFTDVKSGTDAVSVKVGNTVTKQAVQVGKYNPKTGTYQQQFKITANKTSTNYLGLYLLLAVIIVVIVIVMLQPDKFRSLMRKSGTKESVQAEGGLHSGNVDHAISSNNDDSQSDKTDKHN